MARKRRGRGEGSVYKRGDGIWCASVSAGYDGNGKRRRITVYGKTKKEALAKLKDAERMPTSRKKRRLSTGEFLDRWLSDREGKVSPNTWSRNEQLVRLHVKPLLGSVRMADVEPIHIVELQAALRKKKASPDCQHRCVQLLHMAFRHAVRLGLIAHNPCTDIPLPKVTRPEMTVLDRDQVDQLFEASRGDRLHALYVLAVATGLRQGELFALQWSDVDLDHGTLSVRRTLEEYKGKLRLKEPKSAKGRRLVDLPQFAVEALRLHREAMSAEGFLDAPVFCNVRGGHLRKSNFLRRQFRPLLIRAELPKIRFHDLRHTAATLLLLQGTNPKVVSERLGHASVELTLNTYSHVLPTLQRQAAAQLDALFEPHNGYN